MLKISSSDLFSPWYLLPPLLGRSHNLGDMQLLSSVNTNSGVSHLGPFTPRPLPPLSHLFVIDVVAHLSPAEQWRYLGHASRRDKTRLSQG